MADAVNFRAGSCQPLGGQSGTTAGFANFSFNQTTDHLSWIFSLQAGIVVTKLGFRYNQRTGTPPAYKISLQSVTNGVQSGILGGGTPASAIFTPPNDSSWDATWQWITLDNAYTTTGVVIAIVIDYSSGTVDASNFSSFTSHFIAGTSRYLGYPRQDNNGVVQKFNTTPVYGLQSASVTYGNAVAGMTNTSFSLNSTPDEYALRFVIPVNFCETFTVAGINAQIASPAASTQVVITLYDTDGTTPLQTLTWDASIARTNSDSQNLNTEFRFSETTLAVLTAGSVYRIGFAPQSNTSAARVLTYDYASNADMITAPFGGEWYLNTRTDSGAWTDDATVNFRRPNIELVFGDISGPAPGGSGGSFGSA